MRGRGGTRELFGRPVFCTSSELAPLPVPGRKVVSTQLNAQLVGVVDVLICGGNAACHARFDNLF